MIDQLSEPVSYWQLNHTSIRFHKKKKSCAFDMTQNTTSGHGLDQTILQPDDHQRDLNSERMICLYVAPTPLSGNGRKK